MNEIILINKKVAAAESFCQITTECLRDITSQQQHFFSIEIIFFCLQQGFFSAYF
jgi:hypothetical protein